jgi:hypothetical protein
MTVLFDGRAKRLTDLRFHEVSSGGNVGPSAATFGKTYYKSQVPPVWDGVTFTKDNISLVADSHYVKVYEVRCGIGDESAWQPPGSFLAERKGAAQLSTRRPNDLGKWDWYAIGTRVPAWQGDPSKLEWFDLTSFAYQTTRGDQLALRIAYDPSSPTKLCYAIEANVGKANYPTVPFDGDRRWWQKLLPLVFGRRDEWAIGVKNATDDSGAVVVYHRVAGGSWAKRLERAGTPTYLYGTTSYGKFERDGSNWPKVIDKIGAYFGRYPAGTVETVYETGLVRCTDLATAKASFLR